MLKRGAGPRADPAAILNYLNAINAQLDVDGNGSTDALTDGLMIVKYLFGLRGNALVTGALGAGATRDTAQIEAYIRSLMP